MDTLIGIDEVGRGCWAGPLLVVAARKTSELPPGLKDSKKLSKKSRESLIGAIKNTCDLGVGWVQPEEIDKYGLTLSMQLGVRRALSALGAKVDEEIIMDGNINYCEPKYANSRFEIKADDSFPIVSAASIYAKVLRDDYMSEQAAAFKEYGFEKHVGYGTAAHSAALKKHGITSLHRLSFKPVKALL
jgi:ribonuclease HII